VRHISKRRKKFHLPPSLGRFYSLFNAKYFFGLVHFYIWTETIFIGDLSLFEKIPKQVITK
jgi:hypothetical protein